MSTGRVVGWVVLSIGAEAAIVASITSGMLLRQKTMRDDNCDAQKVCNASGLDANGTIASLVGWNTAAWIVAVAGVGAGLTLVLTNPTREAATALTVAPTMAGATLGVRRSF